MRKAKLAMKIAGDYKLDGIGLRQWQKFAREVRVETDPFVERLIAMAKQLPDEIATVSAQAREQGLRGGTVNRLAARLTDRAAECRRRLGG